MFFKNFFGTKRRLPKSILSEQKANDTKSVHDSGDYITAMPTNSIIGLLGASQPAGGSVGGANKWNLIVNFIAWRENGSDITQSKLRCLMPIRRPELDHYTAKINPYQIIEVINYTFIDDATITFEKISNYAVSDIALNEVVKQHQLPIKITHPRFGEFEYDRRYDWYETSTSWNRIPTTLNLHCEEPSDYEMVVQRAVKLFEEESQWHEKALNFALSEYFELANGEWLEEGASKVTSTEFKTRMSLSSIGVYPFGLFEMWFEVDGMFTDHGILVDGNLTSGILSASLS